MHGHASHLILTTHAGVVTVTLCSSHQAIYPSGAHQPSSQSGTHLYTTGGPYHCPCWYVHIYVLLVHNAPSVPHCNELYRGTGTGVTGYHAVGWAHVSFTEPPYPEASQHAVLLHTRLGC